MCSQRKPAARISHPFSAVRRVVASGRDDVCIRSIDASVNDIATLAYKCAGRSVSALHWFDANARDEDAKKFGSMYQQSNAVRLHALYRMLYCV
jgi:hypothetical protein